jgi:hypothetical protein
MKILLTTAAVLSALMVLGTGQNAEARSHFSFNFGFVPEYYVEPSYYVEPVYPPYYVAPQYVVPQGYYYVAPPQCYQVYEYGPFGPVYRTVCH